MPGRFVRICVMSPRQWHGMRSWLSEPEQFQDPPLRHTRRPGAGLRELRCIDRRHVRRRTHHATNWWPRATYGVPIAAVLTPRRRCTPTISTPSGRWPTPNSLGRTGPCARRLLVGRRRAGRFPWHHRWDPAKGSGVLNVSDPPDRRGRVTSRWRNPGSSTSGSSSPGRLSRLFGDLGARSSRWKCGLPGRLASEAGGPGDRRLVRPRAPQPPGPRSGPAQSARRRGFSRSWSRRRRRVHNFKPGTLCARLR